MGVDGLFFKALLLGGKGENGVEKGRERRWGWKERERKQG